MIITKNYLSEFGKQIIEIRKKERTERTESENRVDENNLTESLTIIEQWNMNNEMFVLMLITLHQ